MEFSFRVELAEVGGIVGDQDTIVCDRLVRDIPIPEARQVEKGNVVRLIAVS